MKTYEMTARPVPSVLAWPWEEKALKQIVVTVRAEYSQMGRNNRAKLTGKAIEAVREKCRDLGPVGGYSVSEPKEVK